MSEGPVMRSIRSEERSRTGDPVVGALARMLGAVRRNDTQAALRAANVARSVGGSWADVAWALDICTAETDIRYREMALAAIRDRTRR